MRQQLLGEVVEALSLISVFSASHFWMQQWND